MFVMIITEQQYQW